MSKEIQKEINVFPTFLLQSLGETERHRKDFIGEIKVVPEGYHILVSLRGSRQVLSPTERGLDYNVYLYEF